MLRRLPECKAIVTTGEKATETLCEQFSLEKPKVGDFTEFVFDGRPMRLYRMPSSSRAYPLALEKKKAAAYRIMYPGLTDVIRRESVKIIAHPSCIFESLHYLCSRKHGSSSVGRALVSKTRCREFEPLLPCKMKNSCKFLLAAIFVYKPVINEYSKPVISNLQSE